MEDRFQNKYRIASARLQHWDYGCNAAYFVTICTQNREYYLGDVINGEMQLSEIGKIAQKCWTEIPQHFPFVELGAFVVMPNHVHGIIIINKNDDGRDDGNNQNNGNGENVETQNFASLPPTPPSQSKNKFGPQSKNLASIIRGFKIGVTKNARKIHVDFAWQSRFHDHIIRNEQSFYNISKYIINNPLKWDDDKFNLKKIETDR